MNRHRLSHVFEPYRLPEPRRAQMTPQGFVACPFALVENTPADVQLWQSAVYQLALELTQAELRPSLPERDLLAVWN